MADRLLGAKIDSDLHQRVSDVVQLTGESLKAFVTAALEREIRLRIKKSGGRLQKALDGMNEFRQEGASADLDAA